MPVDGRQVVVRVRIRRLVCPALGCRRQTFREQVPGLLERHQRRTTRLTGQLSELVRELCGRASARLARSLAVPVSYASALGRRHSYATIIINAETGEGIEVLPGRAPETDRERKRFPLILTTMYGNALRANIFNVEVWKPALAAVGVIPMRSKVKRWKASRKDGFHVLRHTYASIILEAGESVVTLARWLGHSSPTITLDCYAHFMPEAGGKGRSAIDALLSRPSEAAVAA
ncbi:integrase [Streptomyces sp. MA5143a]|nr:integrase [Streptomyces sp. MA5143a]